MLAAIPGVVATGGKIAGAVSGAASALGIGGSKPDTDTFKIKVWSKVPFSATRIKGGKGKWKDTVTGESGNDRWSEVRQVAVVASAIDAYTDSNGTLRDIVTNDAISREAAWGRWLQKYGDVSYAVAFANDPSAFRPYGADPANDPTVGRAAPKPSGGTLGPVKDYVSDQAQNVVDAAKLAASNITGVATGAASGAVAGAESAARTQAATQSPWLWLGVGAVVLVVVFVVVSKKRS